MAPWVSILKSRWDDLVVSQEETPHHCHDPLTMLDHGYIISSNCQKLFINHQVLFMTIIPIHSHMNDDPPYTPINPYKSPQFTCSLGLPVRYTQKIIQKSLNPKKKMFFTPTKLPTFFPSKMTIPTSPS